MTETRPLINNLVIFGDSMSDIGRMWMTAAGQFAIEQKSMFVNELGRYSDRRNWTDFLFEWATGESMLSFGHRPQRMCRGVEAALRHSHAAEGT